MYEDKQISGIDGGAVEPNNEGREVYDMDIDRMVNEGLGGGNVTIHNGKIDESTTDTMTSEWEGVN
ncbi:hypothetical protein [Paenibacillus sp. PAMC21692]|uniref:hypothetical protein n=1 Tax=Paenibacillus sp. PAMC21692 TaxID=2762320 RepID=UPI00164D518A|nr:hypothetical protein [Paenibacillus sp. PAMC21692]QNK56227.1 hypothetical protein H7F31_27305 [Paenibacillus sp. PAMC21692]